MFNIKEEIKRIKKRYYSYGAFVMKEREIVRFRAIKADKQIQIVV